MNIHKNARLTPHSRAALVRRVLDEGLAPAFRSPARESLDAGSRAAHAFPRQQSIGGSPVLLLKPNCECCDKDLPPEATDAMICSFECTFCRDCAEGSLHHRCPNCGGELVRRPTRPKEKLERYPASTERVYKPEGCRRVLVA